MSAEFKEKLRTIQFGSKTSARSTVDKHKDVKVVEVLNEDGKVGGVLTEHGDGRVDANVFAQAPSLSMSEPGLER